MRKYLLSLSFVLVPLSLVGCNSSSFSNSSSPSSHIERIYNHWIGYCYVTAGQTINSKFALTGGNITPQSYQAKVSDPVSLKSFNVMTSEAPWDTLNMSWSVNKPGKVTLNPLNVFMYSGDKKKQNQTWKLAPGCTA